jgi:RNA-dependent RNA polymerase
LHDKIILFYRDTFTNLLLQLIYFERVGTRVPYYLNRNVILLLVAHKIAEETFLSLQDNMLKELELMLGSREKAINLLPSLGGPDQRQRMRLLHILYSGLSPKTDPFLFSSCVSIRSHHLYGLRKKARIFIDKGAVLIGGVDETNLLPEFCVFVQVSKSPSASCNGHKNDDFETILGPVMVTKHPVMHPGDVRMLLAVDINELRGHMNVLLFSQKGDRPEPNKMAGSDLGTSKDAV